MIDGIVKRVQGWAKIKGGSDGTIIGNNGDHLKTISSFSDSYNFDAFQAFRTSSKKITIDLLSNFDKPSLYSTKAIGTGTTNTFNSSQSVYDLTVGTGSGCIAIRQSKAFGAYVAGESAGFFMTFNIPAIQSGLVSKIGWFDSTDTSTYDDYEGLSFERNGSNHYFCVESRSTSFTDQRIERANWNKDKLDGTGPSAVDLGDFENYNMIFGVDFQYLGVGRVRFGFEVRTDSTNYGFIVCHDIEFNNSTSFVGPYLLNVFKPIRWEHRTTSAISTASTLKKICGAFYTEGDVKKAVSFRTLPQAITNNDVDKTFEPIVAIRVKSAFYGGTFNVDKIFGLITTSTDFAEGIALSGASITATGWTDVSSGSILEYTTNVSSYSGGVPVFSGLLSSGFQSSFAPTNANERPGWDVDGNADILLFVARGFQANTDLSIQAIWEEVY